MGTIEDTIRELEQERKQIRLLTILDIVAGAVGFLLFLPLPPLGLALFVFAIVFYPFGINKRRKKYTLHFKRKLVESELLRTFTEVTFQPERGLERSFLADTGMIAMGNRYFSDDYICGKYKDIAFEQADVCIQQVTSNGKNTTTTTYFKGRWMVFDFNKNFACELQIREKGFSYAKTSGGFFSSKPKMHKLELEDVEFNREFAVYAVDDHEAYYILTPPVMERMRGLRQRTNGELLLCFLNNRLHVAVNSGTNAFEPPVFSSIDMTAIRKQVEEEIDVITRFVDELKLYRSIYKGTETDRRNE